MDRDEAITAIKAALKARGLRFSVTGGRGTAWGWISVKPMPATLKGLDHDARAAKYREVSQAFGLSGSGDVSIAASDAYRREYLERAQGLQPTAIAEPYWD